MNEDTTTWLTITEASEYYGKKSRTIYDWGLQGKLRTKPYKRPSGAMGKLFEKIEANDDDGLEFLEALDDLETDVPDVTHAVESAGGIRPFLELLEAAKVKSHLAHKSVKSKHRKILCLSDIHCPFQDDALIESIIEQHKDDTDVLVINGDFLDGYGASSFAQNKLVTAMEEYNIGLAWMKKFSDTFPVVYVTRGNHDERAERYLVKKLDPHMQLLGRHDLLARLCAGEVYDKKNKLVGKLSMPNVHYNVSGTPWLVKVGKTIFLHPNTYIASPMGTAMAALGHLQNFVPWDSFDSVVLGHTHKVGKVVERSKLLIEQGSLVRVLDYQKSPNFCKRTTSQGYAVIYQDENGNTDYNSSTYIYVGTLNYMEDDTTLNS